MQRILYNDITISKQNGQVKGYKLDSLEQKVVNAFTRHLPIELIFEIFEVLWLSDDKDDQYTALIASSTSNIFKSLRLKIMLSCSTMSIDNASGKGNIDCLNWWLYKSGLSNSDLYPRYSDLAVSSAIHNERIHVLDWWKNSGLVMKLPQNILTIVDSINILIWWKNNKMLFHYKGKSPLDTAIQQQKWDLADWWINCSGEPVVFTTSTLKLFQKKILRS